MELVIVKLVVSILSVAGLAELAKRVDPALSGILLGLPLGAGLSVYFIAYEQGIGFFAAGLPWAIAGLASSLLFCLGYLVVGQKYTERLASMGAGSLAAMTAFFASGLLIRSMDLGIIDAFFVFLVVAVGNIALLRLIPGRTSVRQNKPFSLKEMLTRGLIAGLIITAITAAAPLAGSRWAGILSSFPSTLYALLVIVHYESGNDLYPAIIFNFGRSVTALAVFYLGCWVILPMFGLNLGFAIVYCISALYLYGLHKLAGQGKT